MSQAMAQNNEYEEYFQIVTPVRFSTITPSGYPSIISLWYLYKNGRIYCATQKNAKVVSYIKNDNKCAFEITTGEAPYKGIRGYGKVNLREDIAVEILESLIDRFVGDREAKLSKYLLKRKDEEVALEIIPLKLFPWDYSKRMKKS